MNISLPHIRRRVYEIVETATPGDVASKVFDIGIILLILSNIVVMCIESMEEIRAACPDFFYWFEVISVIIFTIEYVLRFWACKSCGRYAKPFWGRVRFALLPLSIVDLLAVLPFYLPFLHIDLRFLRAFRVVRIFRVAKLGRYSQSLQTLGRVLYEKRGELVVTLIVLLLLLVVSSCLMYYAERDAQPEQFSSIPAAMWWSVATLTTVGYGDTYPITTLGKLIATVIAILGIGLFALPAGILGSGFVEEVQRRRRSSHAKKCPYCGNVLH